MTAERSVRMQRFMAPPEQASGLSALAQALRDQSLGGGALSAPPEQSGEFSPGFDPRLAGATAQPPMQLPNPTGQPVGAPEQLPPPAQEMGMGQVPPAPSPQPLGPMNGLIGQEPPPDPWAASRAMSNPPPNPSEQLRAQISAAMESANGAPGQRRRSFMGA